MESSFSAESDERQDLNDAGRATEECSAKSRADNINDATIMLAAIEAGDPIAAEQLLALVYDELRRLAASKLAREDPGQTLQPTPWCMKSGLTSWVIAIPRSRIAPISSALLPRRCATF